MPRRAAGDAEGVVGMALASLAPQCTPAIERATVKNSYIYIYIYIYKLCVPWRRAESLAPRP